VFLSKLLAPREVPPPAVQREVHRVFKPATPLGDGTGLNPYRALVEHEQPLALAYRVGVECTRKLPGGARA
jgi:hypothetical protein